jgi:VWFA-related protein
MKKGIFLIIIFVSIAFLSAQEIQEKATAINIEVPVRVFKGKQFIDDLTIDDFEVFEDGKIQKIEAVYLIQERKVRRQEWQVNREESEKPFFPQAKKRNFVLIFEMMRYSQNVGDGVDYFVKNIIMPGDSLILITPMERYNFDTGFPSDIPREKISDGLKTRIRTDIFKGNTEYRNLTKELQEIRNMEVDPELQDSIEFTYAEVLEKLRTLSCLKEDRLIGFAESLKKIEGQKHVLLFFQRRLIPTWGRFTSAHVLDHNPSYTHRIFDFYTPRELFNMDKVKGTFADSEISLHFIYVTERPRGSSDWMEFNPAAEGKEKVDWQDGTMDFFDAFKEIASATGGISESSANVNSSLKKAAQATENYYLLYYTPENFVADGKFKKIEVKVKGKKYRVIHRAGYIAD